MGDIRHYAVWLDALSNQWQLDLGDEHIISATGVLAFGRRGVEPVVLKLIQAGSGEEASAEILSAYDGKGAVRLLDSDASSVLLERAIPGHTLVNCVTARRDQEAIDIFSSVLKQLHAVKKYPQSLKSISEFTKDFQWYLDSDDRQIDRFYVADAGQRFVHLIRTQPREVLLHGDLHHSNIVFDENRGWLAIDPKGLMGDPYYDVGALLRNPLECPKVLTDSSMIAKRLEVLSKNLGFDTVRMLEWAYVQVVLAQIWQVMDKVPPRRSWRLCMRVMARMLNAPE